MPVRLFSPIQVYLNDNEQQSKANFVGLEKESADDPECVQGFERNRS